MQVSDLQYLMAHVLLAKMDAGDVKVVNNKLLGGWYVVRGPHQTPISGRFSSKEEAQQWLIDRKNARDDAASFSEGDKVIANSSAQGLKEGQKYTVTGVQSTSRGMFGTFVEYELDHKHKIANGHLILKRADAGESYWSYKSGSATPSLQEAIKAGAIAATTTEKEWSQLSPGMRREIARSARSDGQTTHRGYLIKSNMAGTEFYVSKGGSHIATYKSVEAAKRGIDELAD